jgi:hypothetical protein
MEDFDNNCYTAMVNGRQYILKFVILKAFTLIIYRTRHEITTDLMI